MKTKSPFGDENVLQTLTSLPNDGANLHEDVVLGEQEGGDLGQFSNRRTVGVRDDGSQFVQRIVEVMHTTTFSSIDPQSHHFWLHL